MQDLFGDVLYADMEALNPAQDSVSSKELK
jgi:hypothetical protein